MNKRYLQKQLFTNIQTSPLLQKTFTRVYNVDTLLIHYYRIVTPIILSNLSILKHPISSRLYLLPLSLHYLSISSYI